MRDIINKSLILSTALLLSVEAWSRNLSSDEIPFINDYDCFVEVPVKVIRLDVEVLIPSKDAAKSIADTLEKELFLFESNTTVFDMKIKKQQSTIGEIDRLLGYTKKIKDEENKKILESIVNELTSGNEDVYKNIRKDASKGKLSDELVAFLHNAKYDMVRSNDELRGKKYREQSRLEDTLEDMNSFVKRVEELKNKNLTDVFDKDPQPSDRFFDNLNNELTNLKVPEYIPVKEVETTQRVRNQWKRELDADYSRNSFIDKKAQISGWEWVEKEDNYTAETLYYPNEISFRTYPSHSELRIANNCAFDNDGNLVRVLSFTKEGQFEKDIDALESKLSNILELLLIVKDYKDNKYGIKDAGADVRSAVENLIGISNTFAKAEEKRLKPYMTQLENALKSGDVRRYNQLRDKYAVIIYGPKPNDPNNNTQAKNFVNQCKSDHAKDKLRLWKIERVSDKDFKINFIDAANSSLRTMAISFENDGPYKIKVCSADKENSEFAEPKEFDSTPYQTNCLDTEY